MPACNALIHEFDAAKPPVFDEDGDQMIGFYYQFIDAEDTPVTGLVGPYGDKPACDKAARKAFATKDY